MSGTDKMAGIIAIVLIVSLGLGACGFLEYLVKRRR